MDKNKIFANHIYLNYNSITKKQTTQLKMGEQVEYAFLPRRNTNGQQARRCRRYLTSWVIKDRQFKTTIRDYFPLTSMTRIKKSDKNKRWR